MVAIPIGYDQPGIANRISYHGVGEFVDIGDLTARRLSDLPSFVRSHLLFADEKLLESKIIADRVPYWIDLQLLNGNVKADRH